MTVAERVIKIVADHMLFDPSDVTPEKNLVDDLGADSLDAVELVMSIEEEFGVELDDDTMEVTKTVGDLIAKITALTA